MCVNIMSKKCVYLNFKCFIAKKKNGNHHLSLQLIIIFYAGGGSCLSFDGCWLIRAVVAEGWGGGTCSSFLKQDNFLLYWWSLPLAWTFRGHSMVINWPNFNIFVSQGRGRTTERKRDGVCLVKGAVRRHTVTINYLCCFLWVWFLGPPKQLQ